MPNRGLETIVLGQLLARQPDERRCILRAPGSIHPGKPLAQMFPIGVGHTKQFFSVTQLQELQRYVFVESNWKHRLGLTRGFNRGGS
jgi:hypothetical protein